MGRPEKEEGRVKASKENWRHIVAEDIRTVALTYVKTQEHVNASFLVHIPALLISLYNPGQVA